MIKEGRLIIFAGISRLDNTRLMRGALDNDGFGRATTFLRQDRQLQSGETIFVDGIEREFDGEDVIVISDAGRPAEADVALASTRRRSVKKSGKKSSKKGQKRPAAKAKKPAAKKSGKKKRAKKSAAKKK